MKNYVFSYVPEKLISTSEEIKKILPSKEFYVRKNLSNNKDIDLKKLLKKIQEANKNDLVYLSRSLKSKELYVLAYNIEKVEDNLLNKVISILIKRNKKSLIEIMWKKYADDFRNKNLITYFQQIVNSPEIKSFSDPPYGLFNDIFKSDPIKSIVNIFYQSDMSYYQNLKGFDILQDSNLAHEIGMDLFTMPFKKVFQNEDIESLCKIFSSFKKKSLYRIIENYLEVFTIAEFETELMGFFVKELGKPTEDSNLLWQNINDSAYKKARQWYIERELKNFFENMDNYSEEAKRRFTYWKKYVGVLYNAKYKQKYNQLFLIFERFAVIEFGEINNSLYIYNRDLFDKLYAKYMNDSHNAPNTLLKNTLKCEKYIRHSGDWESKTDRYLRKQNLLN